MKRITLNGHSFEVHRSKYAKVEGLARYAGRWLTDCYANPSKTNRLFSTSGMSGHGSMMWNTLV